MKLLKPLFYVALFVTAFTACSNDDDGPANVALTNANLAGTWEVTFLEGTFVGTQDVQGTEVEFSRVELVGDTFTNFNYVFTEGGSVTISGSYVANTVTTTLENPDPVEDSIIVNEDEATSAYVANDEMNTITSDGITFNVTRFTSSELRVEYEEVEIDGDVTLTTNQEIRLSRQN